jgi:hypothetical protein
MTATITVRAANISSDGIPNTGDTTDQDFALVCYNCALNANIATLERSQDAIEETVTMGQVVTQTLVISNTGTRAFNFTVSESAAWATVTPAGGTINPGNSMNLSVVFDSNQTAGEGSYNANLSFSGSYDNNPADVSLLLHVEANAYNAYFPAVHNNIPAAQSAPAPLLLPLFGLILLGGWLTLPRSSTSQRSSTSSRS